MLKMNHWRLLNGTVILIFVFCVTPICLAGVDAAPYLRLGAGAASIGVGGAVTSVVDDATSTVWNPAGLASVQSPTLTLSTVKQPLDKNESFLGLATGIGNTGALGLAIMNITVDDIASYDDTGTAGQAFEYRTRSVSLSYGQVVRGIKVGVGLGFLSDSFSIGSEGRTNGLRGLDLGLMGDLIYSKGEEVAVPAASYGVAFRNIGGSIADSDVPVLMNAGLSFRLLSRHVATFSVDFEHEFVDLEEKSSTVRLGVEYVVAEAFAVRGGVTGTRDQQSLFVGFGVDVGGLRLDYALQDEASSRMRDLSSPHYVSLSYTY